MPPFPAPAFPYDYDADDQIAALIHWRDTKPGRAIPPRQVGHFLLASWNIANFGDGEQIRTEGDIKVLAAVMSWFDVIAVQEVKENLADLNRVVAAMPPGYDAVFSDQAGNDERMTFVYDANRVTRLRLAGEIAIPPAAHRYIKIPGTEQKFKGFDRNPFAVAFGIDEFVATIVNAHLYFGSNSSHSVNRRALETYALGRWADLRAERGRSYSDNVMVIGDLNMPKAEMGDDVFDALTKRGLQLPEHQSRIGTTITEGKHYDQLAFFPHDAGAAFETDGVFDFDGVIFSDLWAARGADDFAAYTRYHISDHRPIWARFRTI